MNAVLTTRIIHLHIPKTAGTAFRSAFEKSFGGKLRMCPHFTERKVANIDPSQFDFFSGHFGYKYAAGLGGQIITVVRNPVDRFVSLYYFWRRLNEKGIEKSQRTYLAKKYSLSEFAKIRDEPQLLAALYNTMTWQLAHGSSLSHRRELRTAGKTEADIVQLALANLATFSLVGVQEKLGLFEEAMVKKFSVALKIKKVNVAASRPAAEEIGAATTRAIRDWSEMDFQVYEHVDRLLPVPAANREKR